LGEVLTALKAEIEAAGQKLGFDVNQNDWIELLSAEADSYPLAIGGDEEESFVELMPKHIRARIKALQQIDYLTTVLFPNVEVEDTPRECDKAMTELRAAMALDPMQMPLAELANKEVA
jgi:hypothetical protein